MSCSFKLSRRIARLRAPLLVALVATSGACDNAFDSNSAAPTDPQPPGGQTLAFADSAVSDSMPTDTTAAGLSLSTSFAGGIPFGIFVLPTSQLGSRYNGVQKIIWAQYLVSNLAAIRSSGGRLALNMSGAQSGYKNSDGTFSFTKWKAQVAKFKTVNFSSYIQDGTLVGHYLVDEPNDPHNWGGHPIPPATIEQMAQYSKSIWPNLPTIVRVDPSYLGYSHPYLDAAWAQYVYRKGTPSDFIRRNVSDAQSRGLALVTGMNLLKGGPNDSKMTASQVKSWGSDLLASSYPCAFISWTYNSTYLSSSGMNDAMDYLRSKAQKRTAKTCKGA